MNRYKSLILIGLFAVGFTACKTDDLERDIDALKERVESYEMQVQKLNDEMNIIRVLLDGNKTITDYSIEGDKYTLTLSNGETIVLTQGNDGGNYPTIEIGANGNWFIDGNDTGERAEAENGENTQVTPKFEIKNDTWWVSYNGGQTYEDLGITATGTPEGTSPIDGFDVNEDGSGFTFIIGEETYTIPVVKGLICQILDKQESYEVERGKSIDIKVKVAKGDLVRAVVPAEWKATVSNYTDLTNEQELTITVTAPNISSKCVLSVEVTSGVNTASDEVTLRTATTSYYDDYMAGLDIQIGNVTINKFTHPDAKYITSAAELQSGVNFIKSGVENVTWNGTISGDLIFIGDDKGTLSSIKVTKTTSIYLGMANTEINFICEEIDLNLESLTSAYWLNFADNAQIDNFIFENCKINLPKDKNFSYFSNATASVNNLLISSTKLAIPELTTTTNSINFLNLNKGTYENITLKNNIIYCSTKDKAVISAIVTKSDNATLNNFYAENNTCINVLGNHGSSSSGLFKVSMMPGNTVKNNLYWYNAECIGQTNANSSGIEYKSHLMSGSSFFSSESFRNNIVYSFGDTKLTWQYFRNAPKDNLEAGFNNNITLETVNPFTDGTVANEGKFTYTEEFKAKGVGADIQ